MKTLSIDTRRACVADAEAIATVHDESWRNAYSGLLPHAALNRMITRRGCDWWEKAIRRSTVVLVLEVGQSVVGYLTLGRNRVETLPLDGEIYELYILPEYQGVGFGSQLFLDGRSELKRRGLSGAVVWVLADNSAAIHFYENAGGRLVAEGYENFDDKRLKKLAYAWDF